MTKIKDFKPEAGKLYETDYLHTWRENPYSIHLAVVFDPYGKMTIETAKGNSQALEHLRGELSTEFNRLRLEKIVIQNLSVKYGAL